MESIGQRLAKHHIIGLDTSIFIYQFENHPRYQPLTQEILTGIQKGQWRGVTSTVTIMEVTVPAWQKNMPNAARQYEMLLVNFPNLRIQDVDRDVARKAAQLRAHYRVKPADALQVAAGLINGITTFITNDQGITRLNPILEIIILEDLLIP